MNENNGKISVILPTYNGAEYIHKSINSIISQTYNIWELIIVDDCSTDNTLDIVNKYAEIDKRIRVISNKENKKLPASLNVGFEEASGEYFTWTSDDNAYRQNAFSIMLNTLVSHTEIDLVYSDFDIIDIDGNLIEHINSYDPDELRFNNIVGACFLYRRGLAEKIGAYDTGLFLAEDYEYWIRAYLNGCLLHIGECLYDYARHQKSLTVTRAREIQKATFLARNKHLDALLNRCITQGEKNRFFDEMLQNLLNDDEKRKYRKQYYSMDSGYAMYDRKKRIVNTYHSIRSSCSKRIKKFLGITE